MLTESKLYLRSFLNRFRSRRFPISWVREDEGSWLPSILIGISFEPTISPYSERIVRLALQTNNLGSQPLWDGYGGNNIRGPIRMPDEVRAEAVIENLYTYLADL